jgi:hypothetical protein
MQLDNMTPDEQRVVEDIKRVAQDITAWMQERDTSTPSYYQWVHLIRWQEPLDEETRAIDRVIQDLVRQQRPIATKDWGRYRVWLAMVVSECCPDYKTWLKQQSEMHRKAARARRDAAKKHEPASE